MEDAMADRSDAPFASAVAARDAVLRGDVSAVELADHFLARIELSGHATHALRATLPERALAAARAIDDMRAAGGALPPLAGVPVVVKENCDTVGAVCSAGLPFRSDRVVARDCAITRRLVAAGAVVLGVAVSDPGAFGVRTIEVTHPLDPDLTVGGSSGGSAAALAAGLCLGAIGTDTGGSIRIPSACCGTVGLKPSFGALAMDGIFPLVPSLDHVGPMANSLADIDLMWSALGDQQATIEPTDVRSIGYDPAWLMDADAEIAAAFDRLLGQLRARGVECREVRLPDLDAIAAMHGRIFFVEGAAYHRAHHGDDLAHYPEIARQWFEIAMRWPVADYVDACAQRAGMRRHVDGLLESVDLLLTPTLGLSRPRRDARELVVNGAPRDFTMALVRHTSLFNHTGHPVLAMPMPGSVSHPPASLQIIGRSGRELDIIRWALEIDQR